LQRNNCRHHHHLSDIHCDKKDQTYNKISQSCRKGKTFDHTQKKIAVLQLPQTPSHPKKDGTLVASFSLAFCHMINSLLYQGETNISSYQGKHLHILTDGVLKQVPTLSPYESCSLRRAELWLFLSQERSQSKQTIPAANHKHQHSLQLPII
jgi:hypothetical protein